jgi:hypothetical protein
LEVAFIIGGGGKRSSNPKRIFDFESRVDNEVLALKKKKNERKQIRNLSNSIIVHVLPPETLPQSAQ